MSRLFAQVLPVAALPADLPQQMYALYSDYYAGFSETAFLHDLQAKDCVVLLFDQAGLLRGFSTVAMLDTVLNGRPLRALFSGDTIIHHEFWGEQTLILSWFEMAGRLKREQPEKELFWFLIVKGHRTYRLLHVFFRRYYPNLLESSVADIAELAHALGTRQFGEFYARETGLLDFHKSRGHLKPDWADAEEKAGRNPHIAYFLKRNPEYRRGVELVCLAELSESNLRYFALRGFKKGLYDEDGLEQSPGAV